MNGKKQLRNILRVMAGNITTIISGVAAGFLLPKALSLTDYGFYKTFALYITYTALFNLGIVDGIVLKHGGDDYDALDRPTFRAYLRWLLLILLSFDLILVGWTLLFLEGDLQHVLLMITLTLIPNNLNNYFRLISQITRRFKEYSIRTIIQSSMKLSSVLIVMLLSMLGKTVNYRLYLALYIAIDYIIAIWYVYTYRAIVFGKSTKLRAVRSKIALLIKTGFPQLAAGFTTTLIMAIDRQFVSALFTVTEYAVYAFAYNMLQLVTTAVSAISTVLYPSLKRMERDELKRWFTPLNSIILIFVFGTMLAFFPLCWIVNGFLPHYAASIGIFRIIFPGLAISSAISIVIHNYYKVFEKSAFFFKKSVIVLILSILANGVAYYIFRSMESISVASILTLLIWYLLTEKPFCQQLNCTTHINLIYILLMTAVFYIITNFDYGPIGMVVYLLFLGIISLLFFRRTLLSTMQKFFTRS